MRRAIGPPAVRGPQKRYLFLAAALLWLGLIPLAPLQGTLAAVAWLSGFVLFLGLGIATPD